MPASRSAVPPSDLSAGDLGLSGGELRIRSSQSGGSGHGFALGVDQGPHMPAQQFPEPHMQPSQQGALIGRSAQHSLKGAPLQNAECLHCVGQHCPAPQPQLV